ncbi:hypothetical protein G6L68_05600 [Agrobacterium fabrum]|uniref:hypothetical protein n=1 Tax=Agrobacterium fabrum TaxID=1176649 RepID=UPI000EF5DB97|nr:hypothetical protein [Agrobacterium fabrum]AYM62015.1 hypothetical protein At12D13_08500 [Agrobacterium fabrum]NTE60119.1 hypothetical protein [Agrobacterium fabrum]
MATKLPGLSGNDDILARAGATANTGRVVTNYQPPRTPGLRPVAAPVDMYARPERAPIDNRLADLADALGSLNPALQRYAQAEKQQDDELLPARLAQRYSGRTAEEQLEMMKNDPDMKSTMGQRLIASHAGRSVAEQVAQNVISQYENGFDKENGDIDAFLNEAQRKAIEANPNNPFFAQEFSTVFGPIAGKLKEQQLSYKTKATEDRVQETVHGSWLGTVKAGIAAGNDPSAIATALRQSYDANKDLLFVDYKDQDKAMVGVMQSLTMGMEREPGNAKRYLEVIKEIATQDRTGSDGTKIGTLLDSAALGPDVAKLLAAADDQYGKIRDRETTYAKQDFWMQAENGNLDKDRLQEFWDNPDNKGAITEAERRGLEQQDFTAKQAKSNALLKAGAKAQAQQAKKVILDGALLAGDKQGLPWLTPQKYVDENGEEKTVTVEQQREAAVQQFLDREQRELQRKGSSEAAADESFNRTVAWLSANGAKHPQWEATIKAGAVAMNTVMAGGEIPENAKKGFELYRRLVERAPQLAFSMSDEAARTQYDVAKTLVESGTLSEDRALVTAAEYSRDPSKFNSPTASLRSEEIRKTLSDFEGGWISGFGEMKNPEVVSTDIQKLADVYVKAAGLPADRALERASEAARRNYTNINGWAVRTGDRAIPPDFSELATDFIHNWAKDNAERLGIDPDDLSILPLTNSATNWRIVQADGLPIDLGADTILTTADLYQMKQVKREREERRIEVESQERYEPMVTLPSLGITIGKPKLSGYSKDEVKRIREEGQKALTAPQRGSGGW